MSTGENIKRIRNIRGMTQKELGIAIGIGEESASPRMAQYETGNRTPRESMLNKMAAVLEVDPRNISIPTGYREEDMIYRLLALEDYFPEMKLERNSQTGDVTINLHNKKLNDLSETRMPFKADKTVDEDYFILTLFALALEAKSRGITLTGKDIVLGVGLPPADFSQQAPGFKKYFMEHAKHGISFKFNGKSVSCYLKDTFVSPQNFAAVMCYKASLFKQYRTVNCIDIGDGTVDLLVIRKGQPDLSVRVSDRSGMAILRSEIANVIQQNFGIHLESSDVEQVLMQEATILDEEIIQEIQKMAEDWTQRIVNQLHAYLCAKKQE